jgi:hypothetical protein
MSVEVLSVWKLQSRYLEHTIISVNEVYFLLLQNKHHVSVIKICYRFRRANKHIQLHENNYQFAGSEVLTADYEQCCLLGCATIYSKLCHVISQKIVFYKYIYFVDAQFCIPLDPNAHFFQINIYYCTQKPIIADLSTL